MDLTLVALAVIFVFVSGANDGGALLALGIHHPGVPVGRIFAVLVLALLLGPTLFGLGVARAFTERLVALDNPDGEIAFLCGLSVALLVVLMLTRRGLPTSLTLAVVGGIVGAGLGFGLPVAWRSLGVILLVSALAPAAGGMLGFGLGVAARRMPRFDHMPAAVRNVHVVAFGAQCLAYAANDGQKFLAVVSVAEGAVRGSTGGALSGVHVPFYLLVLTTACFFVGALSSVRLVAQRVARDLLTVRPMHAVAAEMASSAAVFGSAGLGVPVSMTQSLTAGIAGVGASQGWSRVRWETAVKVVMAWIITLPASVAGAAAVAVIVRSVR